MGVKVGIDLGTTFCAVAIYDENTKMPRIIKNRFGNNTTPSVIQFTDDDEIIIGDEAKEAFDEGEAGCFTAFKRDMGKNTTAGMYNGKEYTSEKLSAILLKELKEAAEDNLHQKIDEAVITVPAYFYNKEREATLKAAKEAGLKVRMLINEPTAAALNYGVNHWRENAVIMVYDLGGGTFDVTLLQMGEDNQINCLMTMGNDQLGGKDWDKELVRYLVGLIEAETGEDVKNNTQFMNELNGNAEGIKKSLTQAKKTKIKLRIPDCGIYETKISVEDFDKITKHLIDTTGTLCEEILRKSKLSWKDVTDILLVGGSTRMPQVSKYLEAKSGHKPLTQVNPDEAVALGAAIQTTLPVPTYTRVQAKAKEKTVNVRAGKVKEEKKLYAASAIRVKDVHAHALGIIAVNEEGTYYENQNIIPANQEIPVKRARAFNYYTSEDKENQVDVYLLQGTGPIKECEFLNKYVITRIRHKEGGPTKIRVQYSYDASGIVHVQARQENDNVDLPIREEPIENDISRFYEPIPVEEICDTINILFAIDTSGSMCGERMEQSKLAIKDFIKKFKKKNALFGIIAFSDRVTNIQSLTSSTLQLKLKAETLYDGIGGYGNIADPFIDIRNIFSKVNGRKIVILLTDGVWFCTSDPLMTSQLCKNDNIEIIAVGIAGADLNFLKKVSSYPENALKINESELRRSFGNIAQTISDSTSKFGRKNNRKQSEVETWEAIDE